MMLSREMAITASARLIRGGRNIYGQLCITEVASVKVRSKPIVIAWRGGISEAAADSSSQMHFEGFSDLTIVYEDAGGGSRIRWCVY